MQRALYTFLLIVFIAQLGCGGKQDAESVSHGGVNGNVNMNENEEYIANSIRLWTWSGFRSRKQVEDGIYDVIEEGDDEKMLLQLVGEEFDRKHVAEKDWPEVTDCDKLDAAFQKLRSLGVVALHNAGWDKAEGFHACLEHYRNQGSPEELFGVCYYTTQDVEGAIDSNEIFIGAGSTRPETEHEDSLRAFELICAEIRKQGLEVEWNGDTKYRIKVKMRWEKRSDFH